MQVKNTFFRLFVAFRPVESLKRVYNSKSTSEHKVLRCIIEDVPYFLE